MITKDFLRAVLNEDKKLLKMSDVKFITVPKFDELSVTNLLPKVKDNINIMIYMPTQLPKGKSISREYFMNILNTAYPEYVKKLIDHANSQRFGSANNDNAMEEIKVTGKMWEELNSMPFFSRKFQLSNLITVAYREQG